jgi:AcrR family transcriptional regulator
MPKIVDFDVKRREIAAQAVTVLVQNGIQETNLGKIAKHCGMGRTTLYEYFTNVGELINFTLEETFRRLFDDIDAIRDDRTGSATDRIVRYVHYIEQFLFAEKDRMILMFDFLFHPDRENPGVTFNSQAHIRTLRLGLQTIIEEAITAGELKPVDPESMAFTLFASIEGATIHAVLYDRTLAEKTMRDMELLIEGLKKD